MPKSLDQVQPALEFLTPNLQNWLLIALRSLLPMWLKFSCRINNITIRNLEQLAILTREFQKGQVRYILAFRHPTIDDQFVMFHLLSYALAAENIPNFSAYYVYDRGIPLWAGAIVTYLYPLTGGIPIHRGKLDRQSLKTIRQFLTNGAYPVAIAPEGGTNGLSEQVGNLEPGVAQIGFWACQDLLAANRPEQVVILPVGIQYEYLSSAKIDEFLMSLEQECGLVKPAVLPETRYTRLNELGEYLLEFGIKHYCQYYPNFVAPIDRHAPFADRLHQLLDQILGVAEGNFGIKPKGSLIDRSRRLEQAGWDRIFRADSAKLSVLEKGFANQLAKEANSSQWHLKIAESLTEITGDYVKSHPSPTRYAEVLLLIWRSLSRVKNQSFGKSPYLGDRSCVLSIGDPINLSDYFATYQTSRSHAKTCIEQVTSQLQTNLENLIQPSRL